MKKNTLRYILISMLSLGGLTSQAGNPDRAGQAGAPELLINPWARSSGWNGLNSAAIRGLEAERVNVAGLAFTKGTEITFSRTTWLKGSEIFVNSFGLAQRVSETGVLAFSVMSMDMGEIEITNDANPEGGLGTYRPSFVNIGISYAKEFSKRIYGGFTTRIISQSISDLNANGLALDAGIHYVTGKKEEIKFGISLRNVGTPMKFGGDGLTYRGSVTGSTNSISIAQRNQDFELPSLMNIGGSYDFFFGDISKLTVVGNFTSNSFTKDLFGFGAEYSYKSIFAVRTGYNYEKDINDLQKRTTPYSGLAVGCTVEIPFGKESNRSFALDYAFRPSNPFNGTHVLSAKLAL